MINALVLPHLLAGLRLAEGGEESGGSDIEIGHHVTREFAGMTFHIDTIFSTLGRRRDRADHGLHPPLAA